VWHVLALTGRMTRDRAKGIQLRELARYDEEEATNEAVAPAAETRADHQLRRIL
jgi:hypothetical protein